MKRAAQAALGQATTGPLSPKDYKGHPWPPENGPSLASGYDIQEVGPTLVTPHSIQLAP